MCTCLLSVNKDFRFLKYSVKLHEKLLFQIFRS